MIKRLKITIPLQPKTKKNSQRIVTRYLPSKGKSVPIIIQSKAYEEYEKACGYFIKPKGIKIDYPVNIKCLYYMPTRRTVDLTNLLNATMDILCFYEVILDDNRDIVYSVDGSRVLYSKENPRTEVIITPIKETVEKWAKK